MDDLEAEVPGSHERAIRQVLRRHFGAETVRLRHNWFGHSSVVHTAWVGSQVVVVRANRRAEVFVSTARNIEILRGLGVPAPEVLFSDLTLTSAPFAYIITREIPGRDLRFELPDMSQDQQVTVAAKVMEYQRRVASLPLGTGFGYVGIGERGPHRKWGTVLGPPPQGFGLGDALNDRLGEAIDLLSLYADGVAPTCFLDDLTTKNVMVKGGVLQGLVDFDVVCYGDPLFHLGLVQTAVAFDLPKSCRTYVEHLCDAGGVRGERRRVVDIYSARCAVDFLSRISDPDDRVAGAAHMEQWLERARQ